MPGPARTHTFSTSGPPEGKPCLAPAPTNGCGGHGQFLHPSKANGDAANEIERLSPAAVEAISAEASADTEFGGSVRMVSRREIMHKEPIHKSS